MTLCEQWAFVLQIWYHYDTDRNGFLDTAELDVRLAFMYQLFSNLFAYAKTLLLHPEKYALFSSLTEA